ncbi:hypothetical protein D3C76_1734040 [compost metagenome]
MIFLCGPYHVQKGEFTRRVGVMARVEIFEVALEIFRKFAASIENVQICLVEVGEQVFHVQRFDFLFAE